MLADFGGNEALGIFVDSEGRQLERFRSGCIRFEGARLQACRNAGPEEIGFSR